MTNLPKAPRRERGAANRIPQLVQENAEIVDVWASNLEEEMAKIMDVVELYPYVSVDTEYPGVCLRPLGPFRDHFEYHYRTLKCNVDVLTVIQLGLCFFKENGQRPEGVSCWQFNFRFSLKDPHSPDSMELLRNAGLDFEKHYHSGIQPAAFGEAIMMSGVVLTDDVTWISFHGGYDFAYLTKVLSQKDMPDDEKNFFQILSYYFPKLFDVKYLMKSCEHLSGGLQQVAKKLAVQRVGRLHQAGSDALTTGLVFFQMKKLYFENQIEDEKYMGIIYGLGSSACWMK